MPLASSRIATRDYDEASEYLLRQGMTDGLPVVPPTEDRVLRMIEGSGLPGDHSVGKVPPALGDATIEKIAVSAVMAGCLPEYMPVLVAAVEAMLEEKFDLHGIQTTTNPVTVGLIVNGPIRRRLGINCESGCLGPGWRANATIGRAVRLVMVNLGGAVAPDVDKATQGFPGKFSLCFGENEEESPWTPLHVERGFAPEQGCVTVIAPQSTVNLALNDRSPQDTLAVFAASMNDPATNHYALYTGEPLVVLNPVHAQGLARAGYSKDDLKRYFHERCRWPAGEHWGRSGRRPHLDPGELAPMVPDWTYYMIVVAGGHGGIHSTYMPSFGEPWSVTRAIREP